MTLPVVTPSAPQLLGDGAEVGVVADDDDRREAELRPEGLADHVAEAARRPSRGSGRTAPGRRCGPRRPGTPMPTPTQDGVAGACPSTCWTSVTTLRERRLAACSSLAVALLLALEDVAAEADERGDRALDPQVEGHDDAPTPAAAGRTRDGRPTCPAEPAPSRTSPTSASSDTRTPTVLRLSPV